MQHKPYNVTALINVSLLVLVMPADSSIKYSLENTQLHSVLINKKHSGLHDIILLRTGFLSSVSNYPTHYYVQGIYYSKLSNKCSPTLK